MPAGVPDATIAWGNCQAGIFGTHKGETPFQPAEIQLPKHSLQG
jgi:hypothetical protein